jgi:hypothetical protein
MLGQSIDSFFCYDHYISLSNDFSTRKQGNLLKKIATKSSQGKKMGYVFFEFFDSLVYAENKFKKYSINLTYGCRHSD